jgi:hypothetical protein
MPPTAALASLVTAAAALLVGVSGCSSSSSSNCVAEGTVTVTVTDENVDSNTNFLCDATVTITSSDGGSPQPLTGQGLDGSNASCIYVVNVPPGSYKLNATAPGYTSLGQSIDIQQVGCITSSPSYRMALIQSPGGGTTDPGSPADAASGG